MTTQVSFGALLVALRSDGDIGRGRTGRSAGAHFPDMAVSTPLTAQEIRASGAQKGATDDSE